MPSWGGGVGYDRMRLRNVHAVRYDLASHTGRPRPGRSALRALSPPYSLRAVAHQREGICRALLCPLLDFIRPSVTLAFGHSAPQCAARLASRSPSFQPLAAHTYTHTHTDMLCAPLRMRSPPPCDYMVR